MKKKEGRDYLELTAVVLSVRDEVIRISDMGATLELNKADWLQAKKFIDKQFKEMKGK